MDRALSSDRRGGDYYGPSSGGGGHHGDRGGGHHHHRGRGRGRGGRGRGRGGYRRDYQHRPYGRGGGGGGPRRQGNRFAAEQQQQQDPRQAVLRTLLQMLNKVGELKPAEDTSESQQRAMVVTQAKNVQSLTDVLCGSNAEMFLQYEKEETTEAEKQVGPLGAGLVHCAAVLPLQTPCYVALTMAVHQNASIKTSFSGFASRCVQYAVRMFSRDLDSILLESKAANDPHRTIVRLRLTIRYLALLASDNVVQQQGGDDPVPAATNQRTVSLLGLLECLVQAAIQVADRYNNNSAACLLALLVLSTVPYVQKYVSADVIIDALVQPLERLVEAYVSTFAPGVGSTAILLKEEQIEDMVGDDEEDEDEEDEDDASGQVCDSFQDLLRTVKHHTNQDTATSTHVALFQDTPWQELKAPSTSEVMVDEQEEKAPAPEPEPPTPLIYSEEPLSLQIFPDCTILTTLLSGKDMAERELIHVDFNGIIFGRLPIFGPPPEAADEDYEDEEMEEEAPTNERLQAYRTSFGLVDRYFLGDAVRDILITHESSVTDAGIEHGSAKTVAEQVWSIAHMVMGEDSKGIEYVILETIFSLIVQCSNTSHLTLVYLSRVLLELTRLEPAIISPAIALAVGNLFQDYMPALVPTARFNLSCWFAFHLTNTDYQWPAGYWKHWEPFVQYGWKNSRGGFVKGALAIMLENLSDPKLLVKDCLPNESVLSAHLLPSKLATSDSDDSALRTFEKDISKRIWDNSEDSETMLSSLVGDEASETVAAELAIMEQHHRSWWRTGVVIRALTTPAQSEFEWLRGRIEQVKAGTDDPMDDDNGADPPGDALSSLLDALSRYRPLLLGVIAKDAAEVTESDSTREDRDILSSGECFVIEQLNSTLSYSRTTLEACLQNLLQHKVVSPRSVVRWCLGEEASGETKPPFVLRWWQLATAAVRLGLMDLLSTPSDGSSEMDVDGDNGESLKRALNFTDPLLTYAVRRVCAVLVSMDDETKGSKFSPAQVDLVEGLKCFVIDSYSYYREFLQGSDDGKNLIRAEIHEALVESAIAGSRLAAICSDFEGEGNPAVESLQKSLERM